MTKTKICLIDSLMGEHNYERGRWTLTGTPIDPNKVEWDYLGGTIECAAHALSPENFDKTKNFLVTLVTEKDLFNPLIHQAKSKYKVALLNECEEIHPWAYKNIYQVENSFDFILTHNKKLLERSSKYVKLPGPGTTWITDDQAGIHKKSKMLSHIASKQNWAQGHKLRHIISHMIKDKYDVDFWGSAHKEFAKVEKFLPLKDYCFSITVMNADHENYFTETLVDAFRCGTVPIFWGCKNIEEYFNPKGILRFTNPAELKEILNNLSFEQYNEMLPYVRENFETAKKHIHFDDLVCDKILHTLEERKNDA